MEHNGQHRIAEEEDGNANGCVVQGFFNAALGPEYLAAAAKSRSEAGTTLLKQNGGYEKYRKDNLDDG